MSDQVAETATGAERGAESPSSAAGGRKILAAALAPPTKRWRHARDARLHFAFI